VFYETLSFVRERKVTILKLPPHTTDLLQPLDVGVFKSLKDHWGVKLFHRLHLSRVKLSKAEFASLIASPEVWGVALKEENIKSGFNKCGIFPVNRAAYPDHRFNSNLKRRYDTWLANGKPELTAAELDDMEDEIEPRGENKSAENSDSEEMEYNGRKGKVISYFIPDDEPNNLIQIKSNHQKATASSTPNFKSTVLKSLENLSPATKTKDQVGKRKRVNPFGEIVTSDESFRQVIEKAEEEREKENKKGKKEKSKPEDEPEKKREIEDDDFDILEEDSISDCSDSTNSEECHVPLKNEKEGMEHLRRVWKTLNLPNKEEDLVGSYYGLIYYINEKSNKSRLYVGKVLRRFQKDKDGPTEFIEMECLKYTPGTPTVLEKNPSHFVQDNDIISAYDIVFGPMIVTPEQSASFRQITSSKLSVPQYPDFVKAANCSLKIDREQEYIRLYAK